MDSIHNKTFYIIVIQKILSILLRIFKYEINFILHSQYFLFIFVNFHKFCLKKVRKRKIKKCQSYKKLIAF